MPTCCDVVRYAAQCQTAPMFKWLKAILGGGASPPSNPHDVLDAAFSGDAPSGAAVCGALRALDANGQLDVSEIRSRLSTWYAQHPITVTWRANYDLCVVDPLYVEISDVASGEDDPTLQHWASLFRTILVCDDGWQVFHHGFSAAELLDVLRDPHAPTVESFRLTHMVDWTDADLHAIVDHVGHAATMSEVRHLGLNASGVGPEHVRSLLASPCASRLVSLDLCERLLDHEDDSVIAALECMGSLERVEHLNMYNNFHTAAHVRAFTSNTFAALTHLSIGNANVDEEIEDLLVATDAFPALQALSIQPFGPRLQGWARERGISRDLSSPTPRSTGDIHNSR